MLRAALLCLLALGAGCRTTAAPDTGPPPVRDFDEFWDYGAPAVSEQRFREALASADDGAYRDELLTQIARAQGLQREFEEAHATLDGVEARLATAPPSVEARYLLERGRVLRSSGDPASARPLFERAYELSRRRGLDVYTVDAAHMVALVAQGEEAVRWNERALEVARSSSDGRARRWLASLYNNLGWVRHDAGRYEEALALFEEAAAERERAGDPAQVLVARWCVARCLRSLGRVEEALALQRELLAAHEERGTADGYVHEELGECLALLGEDVEATEHFARAYELLARDPRLVEEQGERLERLARLGGLR